MSRFPENILSVSGVPSNRPDLNAVSTQNVFSQHNYAQRQATIHPQLNTLSSCERGMQAIYNLERDLCEDGFVTKEQTSLPQLEKTLLDISAKTDVTQGVFFCLIAVCGNYQFARYIESGSLKGFVGSDIMTSMLDQYKTSTGGPIPYKVFTDEDITLREQFLSSRASQTWQQRKKSSTSKKRDRTTEFYTKSLNFVKNHWASVKLLAGADSDCVVKAGILYTLKKAPRKGYQDDQFFQMFGFDLASEFDREVERFRLTGAIQHDLNFLNLAQPIIPSSLREQVKILSSISNYHWASLPHAFKNKLPSSSSCKSYLQYCSYVDNISYLPASPRNRLIYFHLKDKLSECTRIVQHLKTSNILIVQPTSDLGVTDEPVRKMRKYADRTSKITTQMLMDEMNLTELPVDNMYSSPTTLYIEYKLALIENGMFLWRIHDAANDVFVMNSYCSTSGKFLPEEFCHCEIINDGDEFIYVCSCLTYRLLRAISSGAAQDVAFIEGNTCMHCRFLAEELKPVYSLILDQSLQTDSQLNAKLRGSTTHLNDGVVLVGTGRTQSTLKYSVRSRDNDVQFVHLSANCEFVFCKSGECRARCGGKKAVKFLRRMDDRSTDLCRHLDMFKACAEVWNSSVVSQDSRNNSSDEEPPENNGPPDVNTEDVILQNYEDFETASFFNQESGLWDFKGFSTHKPTPESDPRLNKNVRKRWLQLTDAHYSRDKDGFLNGVILFPPQPESCLCGAGYENVSEPDGCNLVENSKFSKRTTLYTRHVPVRCTVYNRKCTQGNCEVEYTGEGDAIHFWSTSTGIPDELGYDFLRKMITMKVSFTAFCNDITAVYKSNFNKSATFVSSNTFVKWFFNWAASMKLDFRKHIDPWCSPNPSVLASDGTHIGISFRNLQIKPIMTIEDPVESPTMHRRYQRTFFRHTDNQVTNKNIIVAKEHLKCICKNIMGDIRCRDFIPNDEINQYLLSISPEPAKGLLGDLLGGRLEPNVKSCMADIFLILVSDAPVSALVPYRHLELIRESISNLGRKINVQQSLLKLGGVSPELKQLFKVANTRVLPSLVNFVLYLASFVEEVHDNDAPIQAPRPIKDSYNPESGVAYYFTPSGQQIRKLPNYGIKTDGAEYDDEPSEDQRCRKHYPKISKRGFSHCFLWFCPIHGHCWGFHLISHGEGRKDPFASLFKYLPEPPTDIFYDYCCSLNEFCLNREPAFFRSVRFWHDLFHGYTHKCSKVFKASRIENLTVNSEICEQFNSRIQCIKFTGSHLSQSRFCFLLQFHLFLWNKAKTQSYQERLRVALDGSL